MKPRAVVTCARGSSDHAATFAKYLIESHARVLTSSAAPSLSSLYEAQPDLRGVVFLAISQSGKSPDLLASAESAKRGGALVIALCNSTDSPLADWRDHHDAAACRRRDERRRDQVLHRVAERNRASGRELDRGSDVARRAAALARAAGTGVETRLERAVPALQRGAANLYVVGRGFGLGIAQEAALKLKETCGLHAEAFSAAEVKHGPMALVRLGFPVLMLSQNDESRAGIDALANDFVARGAEVLLAGPEARATRCRCRRSRRTGDRADADDPELLSHGHRARACARLRSRHARRTSTR